MNAIEQFYDENAEYEWTRLERSRQEFGIHMRTLGAHLPAPPARILDVGGGPGRYALALARQGYQVTLLDLSAQCLEIARTRAAEEGIALESIIHGNALDLGALPEAGFDAVLLMGPLYHLVSAQDRSRALAEARRVLKPGGLLAVSFINRYARMLNWAPERIVKNLENVRAELATGIRQDFAGTQTEAYCAHPAEVAPLLEQAGFTFVEMVASQGLRFQIERPFELTETEWEAWIDLNYELAKDPAVHGAGLHLFAVAVK